MERTPRINFLLPQDMEQYLSYYGPHFNKQLYEFATKKMRKKDKTLVTTGRRATESRAGTAAYSAA